MTSKQSLTLYALATLSSVPLLVNAGVLEEVVVTAQRSEQRVADVTTNISFIGAGSLEQVSHTHINEIMQRLSGTWISRGNGQEHLTALRSPVLTGAGACGAFLMMQDGIPLRASGFCNVNELFDANSEQASSIEVIKGPASVVYGSNAMHGLVNVISPAVGPTRRISIETGPHDYFRSKISHGTDHWRFDFNGTSDGGYKDDSGFDQQKATIKHKDQLGNWTITSVLSVTNLNQETAGFIEGPLAYKSDALRKTNPNPEAFRDTQSIRLYSRLETEPRDGDRIVITPYARYTDMRFIQHFLPGQAIEENNQQSIGVQSARYINDWTLGIDAEITRGVLYETQPDLTQGSPFLVATIPPGDHYDYDVTATVLAAFAEKRFRLTPGIEASLGARAERVSYDYDNKMLSGRTRDDGIPCGFGGCRFSRPADRTDTFINVSPKLGMTWSTSDDSQVFAFLSRGYRAPQATELYRLQGEQRVSDIDAEELDSLEVGVRGGDSDLGYAVSMYAMKKNNYIFRDSNRANVDNGETSHKGIEVSLNYQFTQEVGASLNWTYAIHRYDNNPELSAAPIKGNDVDTAPRNLGSATLEWKPSGSVVTEIEWVHLGKYFEDAENLNPYEGHDLINLRTRVQLSDRLT
ncbi:MAG: TonB-dependent receptor, partial [Pseudomonadales bacterium]